MKELSNTENQHAEPTSRTLTERGHTNVMTSAPEFLTPKSKKPRNTTGTSEPDENEPQQIRRKPKKITRKNESRTVESKTSKQNVQPISPIPQSSMCPSINPDADEFEQNFDLDVIRKRHEQIHANAVEQAQKEIAIDLEMPTDTSFDTTISSIRSNSDETHPESVQHSNETNAPNRREPIFPSSKQIDHGHVEVENARNVRRVISVDDVELEEQRKRTISVEDCEIDMEMTQSMTRKTTFHGQQEIELIDLSIDEEEEEQEEEEGEEEPQQIQENENSLVPMTQTSANSFRRHKYKKTPRRMKSLEEIKRLQRSVDLLIPKLPFQRLVREIIRDQSNSSDFKIQGNALATLHEAAEMHLIEMFEETIMLCTHRERATIGLKDVVLACKLQKHYELKHRFG